ncbi:hypothetical protein KW784_01635 [Candidatus Parcubacteria bacterium]|nr:hypothetical protein [Candidatus Parcubacteria bacterium]
MEDAAVVEVGSGEILSKLPSGSATAPTKSDVEWFKKLTEGSRKTLNLEDRENASIIAMRERWGNYILAFIGFIIGFDVVLVWMYGVGAWNFTDPKVVIAVITENFLKILGLGLVITTQTFEKIFKSSARKE